MHKRYSIFEQVRVSLHTHMLSDDIAVEVERARLQLRDRRCGQPRNALGACKPSGRWCSATWTICNAEGGDKYGIIQWKSRTFP